MTRSAGVLRAEDEHHLDSGRAWFTVAGTFLASFVTLGTAYSFGAFFEPMSQEFGRNRSATAVVFGVTTFLFFWLGLVTGRAGDRFGPRPVLLTGSTAFFVGLLATSRVGSLELGYVTYGIGVGIAAGCAYIPTVAAVGGWFERHRATAVGLAVAGIGAGTLVMSPLCATLIERYGWRDTFVILAFAGTALLLVSAALVDRPPGTAGAAPSSFGRAARSPVFRRLYLSAQCSALALFVPFVFVGQYATDRGVSSVQASVLVGALGGASIVARVGFGTLVARYGTLRLYRLAFVLLAIGFCLWLVAGDSFTILVFFALVLGTGYGAFVALSTLVLAERLGVVGLGSVMGLFYTAQGTGGLIGPPVAGWMIDRYDSYTPTIVACAILATIARLVLIRLPEAGS